MTPYKNTTHIKTIDGLISIEDIDTFTGHFPNGIIPTPVSGRSFLYLQKISGNDVVVVKTANSIETPLNGGSATLDTSAIDNKIDTLSGIVTTATGDNLGNHSATANLSLNEFNIRGADKVFNNELILRGGTNPISIKRSGEDFEIQYNGVSSAILPTAGPATNANHLLKLSDLPAPTSTQISGVNTVAAMTINSTMYELLVDDLPATKGLYYNSNAGVAEQLASF